jgi:hypothetical protein
MHDYIIKREKLQVFTQEAKERSRFCLHFVVLYRKLHKKIGENLQKPIAKRKRM